jgi:Uma2 family endonuclease
MTVVPDPRTALARLKLPDGFEPTWDILPLYPAQGDWSEGDYLSFVDKLDTHRPIELVDGRIEVLPVPTEEHQSIVAFLYEAFVGFVRPRKLGKVLFTGLRVRLRSRTFREPDVVFLGKKNEAKRGSRFWNGADIAVEVVSPDDPSRDYVKKRADYARAGIREYWIVDPRTRKITLLVKGRSYVERGVFEDGQQVASIVLSEFAVDVSAVFDAADE